MAVDFSLLPSEEPFKEKPPSALAWTVAFAVMLAIGAGIVLLLWPDDLPRDTSKFWATVIVLPVVVPAFVVLRRYSWHAGREQEAELYNEAVKAYRQQVFTAASIPLALLGAAYRFSVDAEENAADGIRDGVMTVETRVPPADKAVPVKARWLRVPGMPMDIREIDAERKRARHVTSWLFDQLLVDLVPRIAALPAGLPIRLHLQVDNALPWEENREIWGLRREASISRKMTIVDASTQGDQGDQVDLIALDKWLDQLIEGHQHHALLVVSVQLHPLLKGLPPPDTSEAGAAVLLVPDAIARRHALPRIAQLHRPVRSTASEPMEALTNAIRWAPGTVEKKTAMWQTGLDATEAGALRAASITLALTAPPATNLDETVGHAGLAAPWLAVACAAARLTESPRQIVAAGRDGHIDCAVLSVANDEPSVG